MRPFRGSQYYRDLAEDCRTVAEVGPSKWKASYLRLAESYETIAKEMEAPSRAGALLGRIYRSRDPTRLCRNHDRKPNSSSAVSRSNRQSVGETLA